MYSSREGRRTGADTAIVVNHRQAEASCCIHHDTLCCLSQIAMVVLYLPPPPSPEFPLKELIQDATHSDCSCSCAGILLIKSSREMSPKFTLNQDNLNSFVLRVSHANVVLVLLLLDVMECVVKSAIFWREMMGTKGKTNIYPNIPKKIECQSTKC